MKLDYKYFVIRLLEPPSDALHNYVYIPSKWIKNFLLEENIVEVAYPTENYVAEDLVRSDVDFDESWAVLPAKLVCGCDSYLDAQKDLDAIINQARYLKHGEEEQDDDIQTMDTGENDKNASEKATSTSAMLNTDKSRQVRRSKLLKKRSLSHNSHKILRNRIKMSKSESPKQRNKNDLSLINVADNIKGRITPLHLRKMKSYHKNEYVIKSHEHSQIPLKASKPNNDYYEKLYSDAINMQNCAKSIFTNFEKLRHYSVKNRIKLKKICTIIDELVDLYDTDGYHNCEIIEGNDNISEKKVKNETKTGQEMHKDEEISSTSKEKMLYQENQLQNRPNTDLRGGDNTRINLFRWTLKYPEKQANTTELIPGSNIYISNEALFYINEVENRSMLLKVLCQEIFTSEALLKCSVATLANWCGRPALDFNAVRTISEFAKQFIKKRNWEYKTDSEIKKYISKIMSRLKIKAKSDKS